MKTIAIPNKKYALVYRCENCQAGVTIFSDSKDFAEISPNDAPQRHVAPVRGKRTDSAEGYAFCGQYLPSSVYLYQSDAAASIDQTAAVAEHLESAPKAE
jgi:hypothetical protein